RPERPRAQAPAIPAAPLSPEHRRTPAPPPPPAMPQSPAPAAPQPQAAKPGEPRQAEPRQEMRPGEILRSVPTQASGLGVTPPSKVVVPGQAPPALKPGEPVAGQDTASRLRIPEGV